MRATLEDSYLALLRVGFTLPRAVASRAVCSYHTISPLPNAHHPRLSWQDQHRLRSWCRAVYFLLHLPWVHTPQALPGTLLCGARTFLYQIPLISDIR